jgi:protein-disulfide isomerase
LLAGIALAHGAWSAWLWFKLIEARRGGAVSCALGGSQCAAIWDSSFASAVQDWTGLPVAAWGVVWSAVAALMPLGARRAPQGEIGRSPFWIASTAVAVLGLLGVALLAGVMYRARGVCSDCLLSYGLVLAYGALALGAAARPDAARAARAAGLLVTIGLGVWLLLLYPGLRTPRVPAQTALEALRALELPAGGSSADQRLAELLKSLDAGDLQRLSDELAALDGSPPVPVRPARALIGSRVAPVRLTEFHDLGCHHCADLHQALRLMRERLGSDAFALETRQFPLDASCNPQVPGPSQSPVRCAAARLMICCEHEPWAFELAGRIFAVQQRLSEPLLYELASPWISKDALETCMRSPATEAHLADDLDWARALGIEGTPLVLVNGRKGSAWPPFLMAVVLTRGRTDHPLLAHLPPAQLVR